MRGSVDAVSYTGGEDTDPYRLSRSVGDVDVEVLACGAGARARAPYRWDAISPPVRERGDALLRRGSLS